MESHLRVAFSRLGPATPEWHNPRPRPPQAFIAKWRDLALTERQGAQSHFLDLCDLLGVPKPHDPERYCFERGVVRTGSGRGWADVWLAGHFGWEYKAPGRDLAAALR